MVHRKSSIKNRQFKQDINMLEYPLWMQDEKLPSKIPEDKGFIWQDREGYVYRCGYKVPTKLDFIYLMYLLYRSQQEGWKEEIELSRYEILKSCGYISCRPADYERLEDSLERWKMVGIKFQGTFYDGKKYIALSFGVIDTWKIDERTKRLRIRFNREWLTRIKKSSYFKYLNFDQIRALRSPLAMRLYEILVKSFQARQEWSIDARRLAQKIPMKEKAVAHIIPKIKAAVNRINDNTSLKILLVIDRPRRGQAIFTFRRLSDSFEGPTIIEKTGQGNWEEVIMRLLRLVPSEHRAKKTIQQMISQFLRIHGEEYVKRNILYTNEKVRQPRGYRTFLDKALRHDWALGWWEDQVFKKRKKQSTKLEENREEFYLREKVEDLLQKLSDKEKHKLEEQAREELPKNLREMEAFVRMQMRLILRRQIEAERRSSFDGNSKC